MSHDHELCSKIWSPYFVFQMLDSQTEYNTFIFTSKEACLELSIQPKAVANTLRDSRWLLDRTDDTGIEKPQKKKKKKPHMEVKKTEPLTTFYTSDIRRQNGNRERRMLLSRIRYCLWPKLFIHCNTISVLSNHRVFIPSSKSNSCI